MEIEKIINELSNYSEGTLIRIECIHGVNYTCQYVLRNKDNNHKSLYRYDGRNESNEPLDLKKYASSIEAIHLIQS